MTSTVPAHIQLGMTDDEYQAVIDLLGREPRPAELAMYSVMWSEHCSYKSSRAWLGRFPTEAPWVVVGPGENAGVVDLGDGWLAALRIESHNHPSFVEPYQGAATGVGGILRDIFTMGARPVAVWDPIRFGSLADPHNRPLSHYQQRVDETIMPEIQRAKAFMRLFYLYPRPFISGLKRSERLWQATCDLLTGDRSYSAIGQKLGPAEFILDKLAW